VYPKNGLLCIHGKHAVGPILGEKPRGKEGGKARGATLKQLTGAVVAGASMTLMG